MPVGVIATRLAYTQESGERNLHGQPIFAAVRPGFLRSSAEALAKSQCERVRIPSKIPAQSGVTTLIGLLRGKNILRQSD